jgi:FlaA1/EpsC-like NDP-sugar epimerase
VPALEELFNGRVRVSDLREFQIEDLLGRDKIVRDDAALNEFLANKRILVTGAGGSIGSELSFQILKYKPRHLILLGRGENSIYQISQRLQSFANRQQFSTVLGNIVSYPKIAQVFGTYQPQIVFHAAANKHVPLLELNPDEAILNNIVGTRNVLEASRQFGVDKVVCVSSDKAVNPSSVMGCCKRVCELLVQHYYNRNLVACAVRFGNVLGSRGSVVPLFRRQIADGGPVTITHREMKRFFMTIPEAVFLILEAGSLCGGGEIFLLEMGQPIRIIDLARRMISLSGMDGAKIPIEEIGLRPGEKLYEELVFSDEEITETRVSKILRLHGSGSRPEDLECQVTALMESAARMDFVSIRDELHRLVPQYQLDVDWDHPGEPTAPFKELLASSS